MLFDGPFENAQLAEASSSGEPLALGNINYILNPMSTGINTDGRNEYQSPETLGSAESYAASPQSRISRESHSIRRIETDPKVSFLLRHFSEQPGKW